MATSDTETKKSNFTHSRIVPPRSRYKKNSVTDTKKVLSKRRASRRNYRKLHDDMVQNQKKDTEKKDDFSGDEEHEPLTLLENLVGKTADEEEEDEEEDKANETIETRDTMQQDIPPAQDTQLRRTYLQRMYRQMQSTYPHQDDAIIRQHATNVEMKLCQKTMTRSKYIAAMEQEIHKLLQIEVVQANASVYANNGHSIESIQHSSHVAASCEIQSGYSPTQITQSRNFDYAQALAKAQFQEANKLAAFAIPSQSSNGEDSFQSLMSNQAQGYGHNCLQQHVTPTPTMNLQSLSQSRNQFEFTSSKIPSSSQDFSMQTDAGNGARHGVPSNIMETQQQLDAFQMQPQYTHQLRSTRLQQRVTTFQAFSAQIQHLDKSVLIELLWNQRSALAQWQRQAKQLELQLSAQQNTGNSMENPAFHSVYNSPRVSGNKLVCPNVSAEAEMQRARERNDARNMMSQYSCTQQSTEDSPACSESAGNGMNWGENVQAYWDKVRSLKTMYVDQLHVAKRALANNSAPPNTLYSVKAQSVMNNIGLVIDILDEQPTSLQPRKLDVLTSIERFIQATVVPIVRKVQSYTSRPQTAVTLASMPAMATSVATNASGTSPSRGSALCLTGKRAEDRYAESRWSSSSISDMSRQSSRETFADSAKGKSSPGQMTENGFNTPPRTMDESSPPVENSPTNSGHTPSQYAPVTPNKNDAVVMQIDLSKGQTSAGCEVNTTMKEPSTPTSEFRLPAISEMRPPCSPGGVMKESKVLQSNVDVLNDFTDFTELDFDEDSSNFVKENNPLNILMKRGIEDV